ncbi:MAG TPA: hypothetical protein DG577_02580 [Firmicutes bacterium]|jgi:hypothetical protein|nr:hypothetical protein [Bacillota bacterium]HCX78278.1 hypothetical protein [Bacillota bacterium]
MDILHWLILAGIVFAIVMVLTFLLLRADVPPATFQVQRFFVSGQRRKFWLALQKAVGQEYMVLAKVPLAALVQIEGEDRKDMQAWLDKRWADFAILEEKFFKPVAVVQFECQEQNALWALGKDPTFQKILTEAGLPLLWLPSDHYQHVELLRHALEQVIALSAKPENSTPV